MSTVARGSAAENRVAAHGRSQGWIVGSLRHEGGAGDQLWHKPGQRGRLVEVKAGARPYENFRRADREALVERAARFELDPLLAYCRTPSEPVRWLTADDWPN